MLVLLKNNSGAQKQFLLSERRLVELGLKAKGEMTGGKKSTDQHQQPRPGPLH